MYLPPPGKIIVIGAGPIGLEAALYARYLGYNVEIFERGRVAETVLAAGDAPMATPFVLNASPLALAALAAQDESFRPPLADEVLTAREWVERYLLPLAHSDLIVDGLHEQITVTSIERLPAAEAPAAAPTEVSAALEVDVPPDASAETAALDEEFFEDDEPPTLRVHWLLATGETSHTDAHVVIDCSGQSAGLEGHAALYGTLNVQRPDATSGPPALITSEQHIYVIGAKLGEPDFTFAQGLGQIRDLFTLIGDRASLNLYGVV